MITFAEFFLDYFLFLIPMYYEAKLLFMIWLVHKDFSGSVFFFDSFLDEILCKHESGIDDGLLDLKGSMKRKFSRAIGIATDVLAQAGLAALRRARNICS
jgi:receptor expression-enhancing protein 1/2/3/4